MIESPNWVGAKSVTSIPSNDGISPHEAANGGVSDSHGDRNVSAMVVQRSSLRMLNAEFASLNKSTQKPQRPT